MWHRRWSDLAFELGDAFFEARYLRLQLEELRTQSHTVELLFDGGHTLLEAFDGCAQSLVFTFEAIEALVDRVEVREHVIESQIDRSQARVDDSLEVRQEHLAMELDKIV